MATGLDVPDTTDPPVQPWTPERVKSTLDAFVAEHGPPRFDPEARNARHTYVPADQGQPTWRVQQMLVDNEMVNDWVAEFRLDVEGSRLRQQPVLWLERIGPIEAE